MALLTSIPAFQCRSHNPVILAKLSRPHTLIPRKRRPSQKPQPLTFHFYVRSRSKATFKLQNTRSSRRRKTMLYFRLATSFWSRLAPGVQDAYRTLVGGTGYTAKDYLMSQILHRLYATGMSGAVLYWADLDDNDPPTTFSFRISGIMCCTEHGYGDLAWDLSPWGHPHELHTWPGYPISDYSFASFDTLPAPANSSF